MKNYRNALCVSVLLLAFVSPAFAGDIQHPRAAPAPAATNDETAASATGGEMHPSKYVSAFETDIAARIALNLLQNLLPLF